MLHAFIVELQDGPFNIIDNYPDKGTLEKELAVSYKGSKLSPFPGRISGGSYAFNGHQYALTGDIYGEVLHGLLYDKPFKPVDDYCDDSQAWVLLKYRYEKDDHGYPFNYRCEVRYTLFPENVLQIQTAVLNLDSVSLPLADGWHPYFKLSGNMEDWLLKINANAFLEIDEALVPTGKILPSSAFVNERPVSDSQLNHCFVVDNNNSIGACCLSDPRSNISITFYSGDDYPYLVIYTPPHRKSIAIENLSGAPDCFNNKLGLISLPPGHTQTFTLYYKIDIE